MSNIHPFPEERASSARRRLQGVDGGGGGPHDPGMDELVRRVGRHESILDQMTPTLARIDERLRMIATKEDVAKVGERVAKVEGAVGKLPTTLHLLGFVIGVLTLAGLAKFLSF